MFHAVELQGAAALRNPNVFLRSLVAHFDIRPTSLFHTPHLPTSSLPAFSLALNRSVLITSHDVEAAWKVPLPAQSRRHGIVGVLFASFYAASSADCSGRTDVPIFLHVLVACFFLKREFILSLVLLLFFFLREKRLSWF